MNAVATERSRTGRVVTYTSLFRPRSGTYDHSGVSEAIIRQKYSTMDSQDRCPASINAGSNDPPPNHCKRPEDCEFGEFVPKRGADTPTHLLLGENAGTDEE